MSSISDAKARLKEWKSEGTLIRVVFRGTWNLRTFTFEGRIADLTDSSFVLLMDTATLDFSFSLSRASAGAPRGDDPFVKPLLAAVRAAEVTVVEFFSEYGYLLLFPALDVLDAPKLLM